MAPASQEGKAILIFMPGAPEIARLVRLLESSSRLRQAGQGRCKVLPLHGALPSHAQVLLTASTFLGEDLFLDFLHLLMSCFPLLLLHAVFVAQCCDQDVVSTCRLNCIFPSCTQTI